MPKNKSLIKYDKFARIAQPDRALDFGSRCRGFESYCVRKVSPENYEP